MQRLPIGLPYYAQQNTDQATITNRVTLLRRAEYRPSNAHQPGYPTTYSRIQTMQRLPIGLPYYAQQNTDQATITNRVTLPRTAEYRPSNAHQPGYPTTYSRIQTKQRLPTGLPYYAQQNTDQATLTNRVTLPRTAEYRPSNDYQPGYPTTHSRIQTKQRSPTGLPYHVQQNTDQATLTNRVTLLRTAEYRPSNAHQPGYPTTYSRIQTTQRSPTGLPYYVQQNTDQATLTNRVTLPRTAEYRPSNAHQPGYPTTYSRIQTKQRSPTGLPYHVQQNTDQATLTNRVTLLRTAEYRPSNDYQPGYPTTHSRIQTKQRSPTGLPYYVQQNTDQATITNRVTLLRTAEYRPSNDYQPGYPTTYSRIQTKQRLPTGLPYYAQQNTDEVGEDSERSPTKKYVQGFTHC